MRVIFARGEKYWFEVQMHSTLITSAPAPLYRIGLAILFLDGASIYLPSFLQPGRILCKEYRFATAVLPWCLLYTVVYKSFISLMTIKSALAWYSRLGASSAETACLLSAGKIILLMHIVHTLHGKLKIIRKCHVGTFHWIQFSSFQFDQAVEQFSETRVCAAFGPWTLVHVNQISLAPMQLLRDNVWPPWNVYRGFDAFLPSKTKSVADQLNYRHAPSNLHFTYLD